MLTSAVILFVLAGVTPSRAQVSAFERQALEALYNATGGPNWTNNTNWMSASPLSSWKGITVANIGGAERVTEIDLEVNNLIGPLPSAWTDLINQQGVFSALEIIDLTRNQVSGQILPALGNLPQLTFLDVADNQFTGGIPAALANLTNLEQLHVWTNNLSGLIPDLSALTKLQVLALGSNNLNGGIPTEIGTLLNLTALDLNDNQLTGTIPTSLSNLTKLSFFDISSNQLTGSVPPGFTGLFNLSDFRIDDNELSELPDFSSFEGFTRFWVNNNRFTFEDLEPNASLSGFVGSPQKTFGAAQTEKIQAGDNLTLSFTVGGLNNSYQWYQDGNAISGAISNSYTIFFATLGDAGEYSLQVTNSIVTEITLQSEVITVEVSQSLVPLKEREALVALYNSTNGPAWTNNSNWLTGPVSSWYGIKVVSGEGGDNVSEVDLNKNNLSGLIPPELWDLTELTYLDLAEANLTGSIPPGISGLTNIVDIFLFDNQLTGQLPVSEITQLTNLEQFSIGINGFTGTLPPEFSTLTNLRVLTLDRNNFTGTIPPAYSSLTGLTHLAVSGNQLTGDVPAGFANLTNLQVLWVEDNQLTDLPDFSELKGLQSIYAKNNRFTFEDIEPNIGVPSTLFEYSPQAKVGIARNEFVTEGQSLSLQIPAGGSFNQYQWYKDGVPIAGETSDTYVIGFATVIDAGSYTLEITNTLATDLTLISEPINVTVNLASPTITVVRPNGGEVWIFGISEQLQWTSQNVSGIVHIELWRGGALERTIASNTANDGVHDWTVPGNVAPGNDYRIRVTSVNPPAVFDESDAAFRIEAGVPQVAKDALITLYNTTDGANWTNNTNWLSAEPVENWFGVMAEGGQVIGLNLTLNNLTGPLPAQLGDLANLALLALGSNQLTGAIPIGIGNLTNLAFLGLQDNQLTGAIRVELGSLTTLTFLSLSGNQLTGAIPASFGNLANLTDLTLNNNLLTGLADLSGLNRLTNFLVQNNNLTFGDLEPNAAIPNFQYAPQASFGQASTVDVIEGVGFMLNVPADGSSNRYQWFRSGNAIPGATSDSYDVTSATLDDSGVYILEIRNTILPELTLQSEPIAVTVQELIIAVTEPEDVSPTGGNDVPLQAELPSSYDPQTREICFRRTGEVDYQCLPLVTSGTLNTASIPGEFITERGADYFYRFIRAQTIITVPRENAESNPFRLRVSFSTIATPIVIAERIYSMISMPVELEDPRISAVIPAVGSSSTQRLLRWNSLEERYDEAPNLTSAFSPGNAFWYISTDAKDFTVSGGTTVDPSEDYRINLLPGWSQIGNPFAFPVAWSRVLNSASVQAPVSYDASFDPSDPYRYNRTVLEPWDGYWVNNRLSESVVISVQPIEASNSPGKHASQSKLSEIASYVVQLEASLLRHKLRDTQNYLGLAAGATADYDPIDFAEAPGIGAHVRLSIIEDGIRMAGSFKSAAGQGNEWHLELTAELSSGLTKSGEYIQVRLHESGELPPGFKLYIIDDDEGERLPLTELSFGVRLTRDRPVRHLRIITGTRTYASEQTDGIALVPQNFALEQNYPNPFNPTTTIYYDLPKFSHVTLTVYNLTGREVATLVSANQPSGHYAITWDATSFASGVYVYELQAGAYSETRKMLFLK